MPIIKQVRGLRPEKAAALERSVTRQQDMPICATCNQPIFGAAVSGYDDKWRCLPCNAVHSKAVLRESGDSAPNESENVKHLAARIDEATTKAKEEKAKAVLAKYNMTKRTW